MKVDREPNEKGYPFELTLCGEDHRYGFNGGRETQTEALYRDRYSMNFDINLVPLLLLPVPIDVRVPSRAGRRRGILNGFTSGFGSRRDGR